jgi:hypothetical protein
MAKYMSYYDTSGWQSFVEVMNAETVPSEYKISVFNRDGSLKKELVRTLNPHAADRLHLNALGADNTEGLVIVEPVNGNDDFPSLLTIRGTNQPDYFIANRFVPFIRIG